MKQTKSILNLASNDYLSLTRIWVSHKIAFLSINFPTWEIRSISSFILSVWLSLPLQQTSPLSGPVSSHNSIQVAYCLHANCSCRQQEQLRYYCKLANGGHLRAHNWILLNTLDRWEIRWFKWEREFSLCASCQFCSDWNWDVFARLIAGAGAFLV